MELSQFTQIKNALAYIDSHLDERMTLQSLAERFHFSPYYFHRMFSMIVGKTLAIHIRDRRLMYACVELSTTDRKIVDIGMEHGFTSAQTFARTFKGVFGVSPGMYRRQGFAPAIVTVDEMIMKFTNRLKGGVTLNPRIIRSGALTIAGISGDGNQTAAVWAEFERLAQETPLAQKHTENGYEIRLYDSGVSTVHVGYWVSEKQADPAYTLLTLPAGQYAVFDVYVANGYDSENTAMQEWLEDKEHGYRERLLDGAHFCVEYYDERFNGSEAGSIVEIWVPVEKEGQ